MNAKESLFQEIEQIPESRFTRRAEFYSVSQTPTSTRLPLETALLSESALAKDWSTPEEDEAWQHL